MKNKVHFHAGWSLPGCLPNEPYTQFDNADDAAQFLIDEIDRQECSCEEDDMCEVCMGIAVLKSAKQDNDHAYGIGVQIDGTIYEIQVCDYTSCD